MLLSVMIGQLPPRVTHKQLRNLRREIRLALRTLRNAKVQPNSIEIEFPINRTGSDELPVIVELLQVRGDESFSAPGIDQNVLWDLYQTVAYHTRRLLGVREVSLTQSSAICRFRMIAV